MPPPSPSPACGGGNAPSMRRWLLQYERVLWPHSLRGSKVLRPAFHGVVPDLVAVFVEDELGVLRRREPEAVGKLALELARRPAGVAECDEALARAAMVADVAQDLEARRHRDAAVDVDGVGAMVFGTMDHEADLGLHWTAAEDAHLSRHRRVLLAEHLQNAREGPLPNGPIDDDAERTVAVVPHHQDHGVLKARIAHRGRSDQELTGERGLLRGLRRRRHRGMQESRGDEDRRGDRAETREGQQGHGARPYQMVVARQA